MSRFPVVVTVALLTALLAAGCGDGSDEARDDSTVTLTAAELSALVASIEDLERRIEELELLSSELLLAVGGYPAELERLLRELETFARLPGQSAASPISGGSLHPFHCVDVIPEQEHYMVRDYLAGIISGCE